jgi:hypothetical protein
MQIMFRGYALRTQAGNENRHQELGLLKGKIIKDAGNYEVWQKAVDGRPGDSLRRMVNCASLEDASHSPWRLVVLERAEGRRTGRMIQLRMEMSKGEKRGGLNEKRKTRFLVCRLPEPTAVLAGG